MAEPSPPLVFAQRCNLCWEEANGSCFRTQCGHLFCESCAFQHFGQSQTCPACSASLEESDITDLTVGLAPSHFRRVLFQEIYKDPDFRNLGQSAVRTSMASIEAVAFLLAQLTLEGQRSAESDIRLKEELAKQRHENGRLTMQMRNQSASAEQKLREADHKLRLREKELADLQEAYKEKGRKCLAWEKAYGHLRSQMDRGGARGGGYTPPESPRAGAVRGPAGYSMHDGGHGATAVPQQQMSSEAGGGMGGRRDARSDSPRTHLRGGTFLGRSDHTCSSGGGGSGSGGNSDGNSNAGSWPMPRPPTARGAGLDHASPLLRPHQSGFSHSVTPSPTFPGQEKPTRFVSKRPETLLAARGYFQRDTSPSNRIGGSTRAMGGVGRSSGRSGFFPSTKY